MKRVFLLITFLLGIQSFNTENFFEQMSLFVLKCDNGGGIAISQTHILTVSHLITFQDISKNGIIEKRWKSRDGKSYNSKLVKYDRNLDLALFETNEKIKDFVPFIEEAKYGEQIWIIGHVLNNDWTVRGCFASFSEKLGYKTLVFEIGGQGDSGGGVFKIKNGKIYLCGVMRAINAVKIGGNVISIGTLGYAIPASVIQEFLEN